MYVHSSKSSYICTCTHATLTPRYNVRAGRRTLGTGPFPAIPNRNLHMAPIESGNTQRMREDCGGPGSTWCLSYLHSMYLPRSPLLAPAALTRHHQ